MDVVACRGKLGLILPINDPVKGRASVVCNNELNLLIIMNQGKFSHVSLYICIIYDISSRSSVGFDKLI